MCLGLFQSSLVSFYRIYHHCTSVSSLRSFSLLNFLQTSLVSPSFGSSLCSLANEIGHWINSYRISSVSVVVDVKQLHWALASILFWTSEACTRQGLHDTVLHCYLPYLTSVLSISGCYGRALRLQSMTQIVSSYFGCSPVVRHLQRLPSELTWTFTLFCTFYLRHTRPICAINWATPSSNFVSKKRNISDTPRCYRPVLLRILQTTTPSVRFWRIKANTNSRLPVGTKENLRLLEQSVGTMFSIAVDELII